MNPIDSKLRYKCGIYIIFNLLNGKRYIGSSVDLYNRLHEHRHNLVYNKSHNQHLQNAWNKYGSDFFMWGILEYCSEVDRFKREQYYISTLSPEYNLTLNVVANFGHACSKQTKAKISSTLKRRYINKEIKAYRQEHAWIKTYIYNIKTATIVAECACQKDAYRLIGKAHRSSNKNQIFKNTYLVSSKYFHNKNELINFVFKYCKVANSIY